MPSHPMGRDPRNAEEISVWGLVQKWTKTRFPTGIDNPTGIRYGVTFIAGCGALYLLVADFAERRSQYVARQSLSQGVTVAIASVREVETNPSNFRSGHTPVMITVEAAHLPANPTEEPDLVVTMGKISPHSSSTMRGVEGNNILESAVFQIPAYTDAANFSVGLASGFFREFPVAILGSGHKGDEGLPFQITVKSDDDLVGFETVLVGYDGEGRMYRSTPIFQGIEGKNSTTRTFEFTNAGLPKFKTVQLQARPIQAALFRRVSVPNKNRGAKQETTNDLNDGR